ncbi:MAG: anaerobic ribonucleoside-triphosphate reductase activating protein [Syntrophales bacterium]|nr:anaerobic ribonucleoside-triphosphate reductase activating protein [Syntrophales bacterium]
MKIGALKRVSLIDYPDVISAVIFTQGCNFRCPYCHNPELVLSEYFETPIDEVSVLSFLERRRGKLEGVVITGGEPTIQRNLQSFLKRIRGKGYLVKVDTNGSRPDVMRKLLERGLVDYVAMDIKSSFDRYRTVTASNIDPKLIVESAKLLMGWNGLYEFRITLVPDLVIFEDVKAIAREIKGAKRLVLQRFQPSKHVDSSYVEKPPYPVEELQEIRDYMERYVEQVIIR